MSPEVATWWNSTQNVTITPRICHPQAKGLNDSHVEYLHLEVKAAQPFHYQGHNVQAIETTVVIPKGTKVKDCQFEFKEILMNLTGLDSGPLQALRLSCEVSALGVEGGGFPGVLALAFFGWLLMPCPLLLVPTTLMYSAARPIALAVALFIANVARCLRRRRRLWRLSSLGRRKVPVNVAYGEGEPCCICFGAEEEAIIALLPCRHSLHGGCYRSWICTDSYPSRDLICPICRRKVTGVGKLV
ncbi:unnamed protein product [Effrenium voratum]|uniref:RING-type domain-containing protein n=1 Tax=Effrenium voratum TaxID=2562239 RepID=A0AA36MMK7_9DINO|nr:unnamed protein product [Effrenium voratum]CAJ1373108.1 unnamed protein product [Effrenium voratum]